MDEFEFNRVKQYLICKERGHTHSNITTASNPPQRICRFCGTYYWFTEPELREGMGKPSAEDIETYKNTL